MFELMREMRWSWPDYNATPHYVRQLCWIFLMMSRRARNAQIQRANRGVEHQPGAMRVRW
jgi:hypothetical protein